MTFKKISLPPIVLVNLYKNSLADVQFLKKKTEQKASDITFFGGNKKHILLLINNADADYLTDGQLIFLSGVLNACKLTMDDIAIVNTYSAMADYKNIPDLLLSEIVIVAGMEPSIIDLPFKIPQFQVQVYQHKKYVFIPALNIIQSDTKLKENLWKLLRILFSL
jgi:hypothetical protein